MSSDNEPLSTILEVSGFALISIGLYYVYGLGMGLLALGVSLFIIGVVLEEAP